MLDSTLKTKLRNLKIEAAKQKAQLPQYAGHFDKCVLARVKRDIKGRFGMIAARNELVLLFPGEPTFGGGRQKNTLFTSIWSMRNEIETSVSLNDIEKL